MHREDRAVEGLILKYWRQHKNTGVILTYLHTVHYVAVGAGEEHYSCDQSANLADACLVATEKPVSTSADHDHI
ncbi:hypothetical protein EMCRGX_G029921 [Ephydatia muelleri]